MPDQIRFERKDGQDMESFTETVTAANLAERTINEVFYSRTVKGIPSIVTSFYTKSLSDSKIFFGQLNVVPAYGRSYSEDLYLSDESGQFWSKTLLFELHPGDRIEVKMRVVPVATGAGITGRASVIVTPAPTKTVEINGAQVEILGGWN
jgi:hypothetical protein